MDELIKFLREGNFPALMILALLIALVWAVKQWRQSESEKEKLHEARLEDVKQMAALAAEVKNSLAILIQIAGEK